jgi:O-antigen ligase
MGVFAIRDLRDLYCAIIGIAIISATYQAYSWLDFLRGGSYVYQQGVRRIVGVWSGGGLGAPNGFAFNSLYTAPFLVFTASQTRHRCFAVLFALSLTAASIGFSGTRGATLVGMLAVCLFLVQRKEMRKWILGLVPLFALGFVALPADMRERMVTMFDFLDEEVELTEIEDVSAMGRIDGFIDGWRLFLQRPLLGWGPGQSATARAHVNSGRVVGLQLHSMFGQAPAETGLLGTVLFTIAICHCLSKLRFIGRYSDWSAIRAMATTLIYTFMCLLLYGFVSHTLFRFSWLMLFTLATAFISLTPLPVTGNAGPGLRSVNQGQL